MRSFLACVAIAALAACTNDHGTQTRLDWTEVANSHAQCFQVFARGDERKVIVFGPGGRSDTLAVYLKGTGEDDIENDATDLTPLDRIAVLSTTHLPFISALDRVDRVVAATNVGRIRDAATLERIAQGAVREIATADGIDHEQLLLAKAQAVFDYPFGQAAHRVTSPDQLFIPVTEYLEEHPLGRAEWIRFFGVLLDAEQRADGLYATIEERYARASAFAANRTDRPRVFFGSAWQGQWHIPPGNSYMAHLLNDAGGDYCFSDRTSSGNIAIDLETVITEARAADRFGIILEHGGELHRIDIACGDERIVALPVMRSGAFYFDSERSDIFGQALLEPDVILEELNCFFYPGKCPVRAAKYVFAPIQ